MHNGIRQVLAALAATLLGMVSAPHEAVAEGPFDFMRGMVVSCPRGGQIWGSQDMADALADMEELGVDWVAIHPYARIRRSGEVLSRPAGTTGYLGRANEIVRAAGLRFFWKPHLGYWGSFQWRGSIEFADEPAWNLFFSGYRTFILDQARFAERIGAEIFAIGVELEGTTHRPEWRQLIREVRGVYSGRLTYAANWDSLERVPFWDELDLIGVHAYFPLSADPEPSDAEISAGWDKAMQQIGTIARRVDKPVFFAEIGYNRSLRAAAEPWDNASDNTPAARQLRGRLIDAALRRLEGEPLVEGMFWWKWIPGTIYRDDADFSMRDAEARQALAAVWGEGATEEAEAKTLTSSGER